MRIAKDLALITGAGSGIGSAIARRLARDGFHVLIHYNENAEGAERTRAFVVNAGGSADLIRFDVADSQSVDRELTEALARHKDQALQVLVNNAGITSDNLLGLMSDSEFDDVIRTNVHGSFYLMRWCVRKMIRSRSGCIVNIASLAGQTGNAGQINYAASKAALIAMTKTLSQEVGSRGIRVNAVAPGLIETPMLEGVERLDELKKRIPLGRIGSPEDVAGAVSFLCSADAAYVSGHTLSVNGGMYPA